MKPLPFVCLLGLSLSSCAPEGNESGSDASQVSSAPEPDVVQETAVHEFELGEREYTIPAAYIPSIRVGGQKDFIRIKFPDFAAEIVLDEKSAGKPDKTGRAQIFSVTDHDYPRIEYTEREGGAIIACRRGMMAQSGCGTIFEYAGVEWTLLFPIGLRDEVEALVGSATRLLEQHSVEIPQERAEEGDPEEDLVQDQ